MKKNLLHIALASTLGLSALPAFSGDGTLGADSTGTSDITLEIQSEIQITGVGDIAFGLQPAANGADITGTTDFCVYSNSAAGTYEITATSSGTNGNTAFELVSEVTGSSSTISYSVSALNGLTPVPLVLNSKSGSEFPASADTTCSSSFNQTVTVTIAAGELNQKEAGNYSDELVLLVEPN